MSNHRAIATVTAALGRLVDEAVRTSGVESVDVQFGRPTGVDDGAATRKIHIYLYQVTPDPFRLNDDLPTRNTSGSLVGRARAALNLHYMIVFYGNAAAFEAELMLGAVVRDLHARPTLSRRHIQDVTESYAPLAESNLADAIDRVRLTQATTSVDELSKLWSVFFQTPHALSVAYDANVVLIDSEESGPSAAPVLRRGDADQGVYATPAATSPFPLLESFHIGPPQDAGRRPLPRSFFAASLGDLLILRGQNLVGDTVRLQFKHLRYSVAGHPQRLAPWPVEVAEEERTASEVRFLLQDDDANAWRIGPYTVSLIVTKEGREYPSNEMAFLLTPRVSRIDPAGTITGGAGTTLRFTLESIPQVPAKQPASLLVGDRAIAVEERTNDDDPLIFEVPNAPTLNDAVIRLHVDGVDSIPYQRLDEPPYLEFAADQKVTIT